MIMRVMRWTWMLALSAVVAGCSARGPYVPPATAPAAPTRLSSDLFVPRPYDARWWTQFDDPVLQRLQDLALTSNLDVRAAVARVEQARAVFDDVKLDRYPTATVGGGVEWREQAVPGFTGEPIRTTTYRAALDMFWEIDLFGRVRSATRSAAATAQEYEAALQDIRVVIAAEVARNYFELRGLQQQRAVVERSLVNQQETLRLT